jgi:hypothetical protein
MRQKLIALISVKKSFKMPCSQSDDTDLQRQRCKKSYSATNSMARFIIKIFFSDVKTLWPTTTLAVAVNSKVVGLARLRGVALDQCNVGSNPSVVRSSYFVTLSLVTYFALLLYLRKRLYCCIRF